MTVPFRAPRGWTDVSVSPRGHRWRGARSIRRSRGQRIQAGSQAGMTLAELTVTMGVAGVLLIALSVIFTGALRTVSMVNTKTATVADARIVTEAVTRSLRVTIRPDAEEAAIVSATPSALTFYASLNRSGSTTAQAPNPTRVSYSYDGTCINQNLLPATVSSSGALSWTGSGATTCLARTTSAPVFSYYASGTATTAMSATGGLSPADRKLVRSVGISVSVQDPKATTVGAVTIQDRVTLTNMQINSGS